MSTFLCYKKIEKKIIFLCPLLLIQEINFTSSVVKFNLQLIVRFKNQKYTKKMSDGGFQGLMLGQQKCPQAVFQPYARLSITHRKVMQII